MQTLKIFFSFLHKRLNKWLYELIIYTIEVCLLKVLIFKTAITFRKYFLSKKGYKKLLHYENVTGTITFNENDSLFLPNTKTKKITELFLKFNPVFKTWTCLTFSVRLNFLNQRVPIIPLRQIISIRVTIL